MRYVKTIRDGEEIKLPYFLGTSDFAVRKDWLTEERHSVVAIIKNLKTDEYLCVEAKMQSCRSFVMGGIENGEAPEDAALREVAEETGYDDVVIDKVDDIVVINHFFAGYKNVNRYAYIRFVYGRLKTNHQCEVSGKEKSKQIALWIPQVDLLDFLNVEMCQWVVKRDLGSGL